MNNPLTRRALSALSHPLSVTALFVLLINDHWLKKVAPSWLTGKLSDVAGFVFVPFVLLTLLAFVLPIRCRRHERALGLLALFIVGGAFALIKTLPAARDAAVQLSEIVFGWSIIIRIDPTDLLALPALLITWHIWDRSATTMLTSKRSWPLLALSTIALVASSPPYPNLGAYCLSQTGTEVSAYTSSGLFVSEDGGSTWQFTESPGSTIEEKCRPLSSDIRELVDPSDPDVRYRITPYKLIERSVDGGKTWKIELAPTMTDAQMLYYRKVRPQAVPLRGVPLTTTGPYDALTDPQTENLIVAMGQEGVAVRTPAGQWRYVAVGPYARVELNRADSLLPMLRGELLSAAVLLFLVLATLMPALLRSWRSLILFLAWMFWVVRLVVVPHDSFTISGFDLPLWLGLIFPALVAVPLGIMDAAAVWVISKHVFRQFLVLAVSAVVLFLIPYWLWSQGGIQQYQIATFLALGTVILLVVVGRHLLDVDLASSAASPVGIDQSQEE